MRGENLDCSGSHTEALGLSFGAGINASRCSVFVSCF